MKLARPSLGQLLPVLFFLIAAIPAGAIGVLLTRQAWDRELRTVQEQHLQIARNLVAALTRYAQDVEAAFQVIVTNIDEHQSVRRLSTLLSRLHFQHVCIIDSQGRVEHLVAPDADFKVKAFPLPLLEQLRAGGSWEVLPSPAGEPKIYVLQPLKEARYAVGALDTAYFVALQSTIAFGQKGHAAIVDRRGRIIAHPNPQWRATMRDISHVEPVRRMMDGETGVQRFFAPAFQEEGIAGFSTVPEVGWGVMIPQPLSELEAHVWRAQRAVWLVIGSALLCSALLGACVSRWLTTPLRRIGAVAERFAHGAYEARIHAPGLLHTREAATLAAQFNSMADDVNRSWHEARASEERFRAFAHIAADWFWETDLQQVFTYVSPPPAPGHRRTVTADVGHHRGEYVYGDPENTVVTRIQSYMDQMAPFDEVEYQLLGYDGHPVHVAVSGRPVHDTQGVVVGYRGITRDITARLHAEERLRQVQQDVQRRQTQKMEAIGVLAGGIAHDFNNILSAILGYTDLALHEVSPGAPIVGYLQEVLTAGRRAQDLVRQILTFSRANAPERLPIQLHAIVKEALNLLRASLPTTIEIRQHLDRNAGTVLADPTQMHQILMNLCANAEYAMRETGGLLQVDLDTVDIDTVLLAHHTELAPGSYLRLTIRDTGQGIAPDISERIFEPFFTTKNVGQGTGMGLAVVHGIVLSHGGAITMQSTPGLGTAFSVYLPRVDMRVEGEAYHEAPAPSGQGSVLFVDDEASIAHLGREMLEQLGYTAVVCTSSLVALDTFRQTPERFDLVITDQTMPHMTGAALARELRGIRPDIPIILCTGFSHAIDAEKARAQGIDAFLMKPLVARELGWAIQQVLAQRGTA